MHQDERGNGGGGERGAGMMSNSNPFLGSITNTHETGAGQGGGGGGGMRGSTPLPFTANGTLYRITPYC